MIYRKFLALFAVALLATSLVACGGGGSSEEAAGGGKIVLWEMMDPPERELLNRHLDQFRAQHPDVEIEVAHFGVEDVRSNFLTAALGGGGPDIVYGPSDQVGPLSIAGTLRPVDEVFGRDYFDRFHPLTRIELNGHIWSVPEQFGNHLVLVMNGDLVPEIPQTTDELLAIARANTVDEDGDGTPDRYGLVFETKEPFWLAPWLGGYGGWVMDDAGDPTLDSAGMRNALAFLRDLKYEHAVVPRDCDYQLADTLFKEGRAAMTINGPWSWTAYREANIPLKLAAIPSIPGAGDPSPMVSYRGYSIAKSVSDSRLPLVKELVSFLTSEDVQRAYRDEIRSLPSLLSLQEDGAIEADAMLNASMEQANRGKPMPVVPEMRAIWDAMRPELQNVMNGEAEPAEAAREMQENAVQKIAEMRG